MESIDHRGVLRLQDEGAQIVDVLPAHEYRSAHIRGAIHLPLGKIFRDALGRLTRELPAIVYCRDSLCDLSARAAAQLEFLGLTRVFYYPRGKADWLVRGLPSEPLASAAERLHALPYFLNNLAPGPRDAWIRLTSRARVDEFVVDDLPRLAPDNVVPKSLRIKSPRAVVLNRDGVLLGSIDQEAEGSRAIEAINGGPQTIRPEMTPALASTLLGEHPYLLVTMATGSYIGRYRLSILANSG